MTTTTAMTPRELVGRVKNLPAVSHAALKLVSLLDQPAVSNEDVVEVLKYDNVLTAKLLRSCNSPYFGLEESVSSVEQAVFILGHQQILHVVLSLAFGGAMSTPLPGYGTEAKELWSHSLQTALAGEIVVRRGIPLDVEPAVAFTAGLLHDIGKLVFNHVLTPDVLASIRSRITEGGLARTEAEKEIIGTDHAEVGACLLEQWRLPETIIEAVAHHHAPVAAPKPRLSVVVHTANCLAHFVGSTPGWEGFAFRVDAAALSALNITPENLQDMMIPVHESAKKVEQFMSFS
jgi:putative nucleotidyltransferase with HDIG domain